MQRVRWAHSKAQQRNTLPLAERPSSTGPGTYTPKEAWRIVDWTKGIYREPTSGQKSFELSSSRPIQQTYSVCALRIPAGVHWLRPAPLSSHVIRGRRHKSGVPFSEVLGPRSTELPQRKAAVDALTARRGRPTDPETPEGMPPRLAYSCVSDRVQRSS